MLDDLYEDVARTVETEELFEGLIESVYLAGSITGEAQELAYLWLRTNDYVIQ